MVQFKDGSADPDEFDTESPEVSDAEVEELQQQEQQRVQTDTGDFIDAQEREQLQQESQSPSPPPADAAGDEPPGVPEETEDAQTSGREALREGLASERATAREKRAEEAERVESGIERLRGGLGSERRTSADFRVSQEEDAEQSAAAASARLSGAAAASSARANEIERRLEEQIEEETGREVDLDQSDIEFTTEDGKTSAVLAESGADKVATAPLTNFLEEKEIDFTQPGLELKPGPFAGEFPGAKFIGAGVEFTEPKPVGAIAEGVGQKRDLGDTFGGLEIAEFGERGVTPGRGAGERQVTGTKTVDEVLGELSEDVRFVELGEAAFKGIDERPGRAGAAQAQETREFTGVGFEPAQAGSKAVIESPGIFAVGASQLAVDIADFQAEIAKAVTPEFGERETTPGPGAGDRDKLTGPDFDRIGQLFADVDQTVKNTVAVGASQAIESPAITAATAAGTLVGSGVIFGGAAAIGPRTSLATRFAIQPGEEIAGIGGFAATRRLAGRGAAQRLFPNKEPLIFSEEAVIRATRGASRRVQNRFADIDVPRVEANVEGAFGELRTQTQIDRGRLTPPFREPRVLMEGQRIDVQPRQVGAVEVFDTEFGMDLEAEAEADDADLETDDLGPGEGGMSVGGSTEFKAIAETETESGQVVQQEIRFERGAFDIETEPEGRLDSELAEEARARRLESNLFGEGVTGEIDAPAIEQVFEPGEVSVPGEGAGELEVLDFDTEFEPADLELEFEDTEFEGEGEFTPTELEFEEEAELEQELELEAESEFEAEVERDGRQRRDIDPLDKRRVATDPRTRLFEFDVPTVRGFEKKFEKLDFKAAEAPGVDAPKRKRRDGFDIDLPDIEVPEIDLPDFD